MWTNTLLIFGLSLIGFGLSLEPIVNRTNSNVWVSFEDNTIKSVLFYAEMNNKCPGKYVYAFNSTLSHPWVMQDQLNTDLNENNMRLFILMNAANNKIYSKTYDIAMKTQNSDSIIIKSVNRNNPRKSIVRSSICTKLSQPIDNPTKICIPTETKMSKNNDNHGPKCSGELIFDANFMNNIDYTIWTPHKCIPETELVEYKNDTSVAHIKNKRLHLRIEKHNENNGKEVLLCTLSKPKKTKLDSNFAREYRSRGFKAIKLHTNNTFSFQNGRIEIRAKMPIGDFLMPIMDLTSKYDGNVAIRLAYARGNEELISTANTHIGGKCLYGGVKFDKNENEKTVEKMSNQHYGQKMHNYTVIWHSDRIIYKINGKTFGTIREKHILAKLQEHEFFFTLGITFGGNNYFVHQNMNKDTQNSENYFDFNDYTVNLQVQERPPVWKEQELIIKSLKVYSTHALEE
ncbi:gram-negative bacteria-binding protein 2-like [Drosophila tropicalis]|uniref:gram-negative bacteria-binding protein 2-like n=1 Tax=Drosophila tropicalis TaxID=46794 RepID=UPI0035AC1033